MLPPDGPHAVPGASPSRGVRAYVRHVCKRSPRRQDPAETFCKLLRCAPEHAQPPEKKRFWPPGLPGPALMETLVESQMTRRQARGGFVCSDPCSPRDRGHSWEPVRGPLSALITAGRPENSVVDFGATLTLSCGLLLARGKLRSTIIPSSRYPDLAPVSRRPRQRDARSARLDHRDPRSEKCPAPRQLLVGATASVLSFEHLLDDPFS